MVGRVAYGTSTAMSSQCDDLSVKGDYFCVGERRMAIVSKVHDMPRCLIFPNVPDGDELEVFQVFGACRDFLCPLGVLCQDMRKLLPNEDIYEIQGCFRALLVKPGLYEFKLKSGNFLPDDFYHEDIGIGVEWVKCLKDTITNVF